MSISTQLARVVMGDWGRSHPREAAEVVQLIVDIRDCCKRAAWWMEHRKEPNGEVSPDGEWFYSVSRELQEIHLLVKKPKHPPNAISDLDDLLAQVNE